MYQELGQELEAWNPPIPEPLRALARIRHFNLFVSTTFDNLLERAINEERFGGQARTEVVAYSPKHVPDDTHLASVLASGRVVVFQMFGHFGSPLQYALTDGDRVEYMHALQSAEYRPKRLLSELSERPLLFIGNSFPDWLTRMFLRMVRKTALDNRDIPKQYLSCVSSSATSRPIPSSWTTSIRSLSLPTSPAAGRNATAISRLWRSRRRRR